ncbi:MAG: alcohol dehydrogenase catalytic domain-containing protein [Candidatus Thorarchaeota archaeon]|nr:alcohol dehydrogenase catalytic domain-containing protein [Candidatus Thorarchaeota archaeon]
MRGLVKTAPGNGNLELKEFGNPRPGSREVLVEVAAAGICGTDVHIKHGTTFCSPPVVMGHEYAGRVVKIDPSVDSVQVGDAVTSPATAYCGKCYQCKTGHMNRCTSPRKRILGASTDGAFARHVVVPEYIIHKVPKGLSLEEAALAEPTACVVHTIAELTPILPGDTVVVLGPGTTGLVALQVAKAMGAAKVIVTGMSVDRWKLDIAERLGADITIDVQAQNTADIVKSETDGVGADVVIEASGSGAARKQAFDLVKTTGHISLIGIQGRSTEIPMDDIVTKELHVLGTWGTLPSTWVTTLRMMASGKIDVRPLITHRLPLSDWQKGFELMESQKAIKVLFTDLN